jgi:pilus assembly protein Flp/PilA
MSLQSLIARLKGRTAESDTGATATEYAILLGFIAIVIVVGITAFGTQLNAFYNVLATKLAALL